MNEYRSRARECSNSPAGAARYGYRGAVIKTSVCSARKPVAYYWRECTGDHVRETVDKLMDVVNENRKLNDYQSSQCQASFEELLETAQDGRLIPGDHVKTIRYDPAIDMFEFRWIDLSVTPQDPVTGLYGAEVLVHVRLYYVEEGQPWVVGLHCHEKEFLEDDEKTDAAQDVQIKIAVDYHYANEPRSWGVAVERSATVA